MLGQPLREVRPDWQASLRRILPGVGLACLVLGGVLAYAAWMGARDQLAVVVADEAVVRFGPVDESRSAFTLGDGAEVRVIDAKAGWWKVEDAREREGWVSAERLAFLVPERSNVE